MLTEFLGFFHNASTLLFGVYISSAFLGIKMTKKNIAVLMGFSLTVGTLYIASFLLLGADGTKKIYPLIIHLPLVIFLTFYFKYKFALSLLSVLTAYLCCQISNWVGLLAVNVFHTQTVYYSVRIAITAVTFILLIRFVSSATSQLLQKNTRSLLILGLMPFVYYLYDYAFGVYTGLLYSGIKVVVEFLGFILCISYILFIFLYFKQYEEKREAEQINQLMEMKRVQSEKEIEAMRRSEKAISILRHDMRHFLSGISVMITNGEYDKAQECIKDIISAADSTASKRYCKNETVNIILSSLENRIESNKINFEYAVNIHENLPFSDVDITAILSNGLENAINAVVSLPEDKRFIRLDMRENGGKLLISIKNTYLTAPKIVDGLPKSMREGHGFGSQSIRYVAEKLKGNCQFNVSDDYFILQVIL